MQVFGSLVFSDAVASVSVSRVDTGFDGETPDTVTGAPLSARALYRRSVCSSSNTDVGEPRVSSGDPLRFTRCRFPSSSIDSRCDVGVGDGVFVLQTRSPSSHTHTQRHTLPKYYLLGGRPAGGKLSAADKLMECALQTKHAALIRLVVRM